MIEESFDLNSFADVRYSYGDDLLHQHRRIDQSTTQSRTFHYDAIGSTRQLTDTTGAVSDDYAFEAFGELEGQSGITANDYLFTGEQWDPTLRNYYLRARYYDPDVGRFGAMDFVLGDPQSPLTIHKYAYANVNPANFVDPAGTMAVDLAATTKVQGILLTGGLQISVQTARKAVVGIVVGVGSALLLNEINKTVVLAESTSSSVSGDSARRQSEYETIKRMINSPPPEGPDQCSNLSKRIDHAQKIIDRYRKWDARWQPGRHDEVIGNWQNRLDNLKKEHNKRCVRR